MEPSRSARGHRVALEALAPRRLRSAWGFEGRGEQYRAFLGCASGVRVSSQP